MTWNDVWYLIKLVVLRLCEFYQRTSSPCSRKFFRLGSVCCRSGVVKPCWYLSYKKKKETYINLKTTSNIIMSCMSSVRWPSASACAVRHQCTLSMLTERRKRSNLTKRYEVYIVSAWLISILTIWLLLIWTQFHPSLIPGMCSNT